METWESGLIQRLAKASYPARGTVSSNLTVSAIYCDLFSTLSHAILSNGCFGELLVIPLQSTAAGAQSAIGPLAR